MTRERHILLATLALSAVLAGLQYLAFTHYLYWTYWWYDVMMHFLTGAIVGGFAYWLLFASGGFFKASRSRAFMVLSALAVALAIGFFWEVLEYANGITDSHEGYLWDTANDLILDTCGAALAALIATRKKRHG